jgi:hypothetical protein
MTQKHYYQGRDRTIKSISALTGMSIRTIQRRIKLGIPLDRPRAHKFDTKDVVNYGGQVMRIETMEKQKQAKRKRARIRLGLKVDPDDPESHKKATKVFIDGIAYESLGKAAAATKFARATIARRMRELKTDHLQSHQCKPKDNAQLNLSIKTYPYAGAIRTLTEIGEMIKKTAKQVEAIIKSGESLPFKQTYTIPERRRQKLIKAAQERRKKT